MSTNLFKGALAIIAAMTCVAGAQAQQKITKDQLVGTWNFSATFNESPNGQTFDPLGGKGTGILMFDKDGHFAWELIRSDTPKFASGNRLQGTPEEYKGVSDGILVYFGTYTVDDSGESMIMHIDQSSFGNFRGQDTKRTIRLNGDELSLINATGASGGKATVVWKRAK